jgi:3-deoxy-D-manno-octulosonic-acid transferase
VWVLASSHPGEEELALAAHQLLRHQHADALLILVPRDAGRGAAVAALCEPDTPLRSQGALLPGSAACYVADTMGELGLWYRLSHVAMVGGSWAPVGGHNPYEAITLGNTVLHGPNVANFSESYADLDVQGLSRLALSAEQLAANVAELWAAANSNSASAQAPTERHAAQLQQLLSLLPTKAARQAPLQVNEVG